MADHTSAELFGTLFRRLARAEPLDRVEFARWLWEKSQGYDFHPCQMECTEALLKLGLAREGIDPEYPQDGETTLYGPEP